MFTHSYRGAKKALKLDLVAALVIAVACSSGFVSTASAHPLDASWTQVGLAKADDTSNLFDGACGLQLTGCTFSSAGGDFWTPFAGAQQMLFITGDRLFWGQASYAAVIALENAAAGNFLANLTWINAGRNGVDLGAAVTGNLLERGGSNPEDPWVTLEGNHCASACTEILWGESGSYSPAHATLMEAHGGLEVYARGEESVPVPEPMTLALLGLGLAGIGFSRRKRAS